MMTYFLDLDLIICYITHHRTREYGLSGTSIASSFSTADDGCQGSLFAVPRWRTNDVVVIVTPKREFARLRDCAKP